MSNSESETAGSKTPAPVHGHLPTTFLERGIAVPFTTPQLAGARVRPGGRAAMELIVPNPSGGRGVYIVPWEGITALCRPTVHDARLSAMVATVHGVTPATIRKAAHSAAALGYAGRAAAAAARAAEQADRQAGLITNFSLLLELVRAIEPKGENPTPAERAPPAELERRARRAMAIVAPELGRTPESVAAVLEQVSALYSGIGLRANTHGARLPTLVAHLLKMRQELAIYMETNPGESATEADLIAGAIDLTTACAQATMVDGYGAASDIKELLRAWIVEPEQLAQTLARPEWLLDGWDRIAALWETRAAATETTLTEMCNIAPVVPREAGNWVSQHINVEADLMRHRRKVVLLEDWRTGRSVIDLIARNEAMLAHAE